MTDVAQSKPIATPGISQTDLESLEKLYTFREKNEIVEFLEKYPFLVTPLLEAPEKIRKYFTNDEQLFLEVVPDPEIVDYVELVISIFTRLDPYEATNRENQVDADWWRGVSFEVWQKLCIVLEFPD